jgi:photosynthetic reaction center cytochrome c subunit
MRVRNNRGQSAMSAKIKMSRFTCFILVSGVVVCLANTNRTSNVAASGEEEQISSAVKFSPSGQGSPAAKTIDQTGKNIQVLKGLPESQMYLLMNFVATSLGVQCNFCHVQQGKDPTTGSTNWVWESDDKPQKQTARRMMQMVLAIKANDKVDFRENEVTCYTCHRGQRKPIGLPPMPLARSAHEPEPENVAVPASTSGPSLEQIFGRYFEALGGSAATNTKTLVLKARREASQNRNWSNEITLANPDKFLVVANTARGTIRQIVNGDKGWSVNGTNARPLTPAETLIAKHSWNELFNVVKVKPSQGMRLRGTEKVGDREAYVIENATDTKTDRYYFDSQTGLLLRKITLNKTVIMPFPEQLDFEDYRDVDGVKMPFTIRYSAIDTYDSWTRTFTEIKRNVAVEDTSFVIPSPK